MDAIRLASIERRDSREDQSFQVVSLGFIDLYVLFQLVEHHHQRDLTGPKSLPKGVQIRSVNSWRNKCRLRTVHRSSFTFDQ